MNVKVRKMSPTFLFAFLTLLILGHPKPKKMLIFRFVGIFEYIILLMLILFLDMCQNSKETDLDKSIRLLSGSQFVNSLYCIVLYCIVMFCIVLYCIVLYCIVLYLLYCIVLYCIVLYCIVL